MCYVFCIKMDDRVRSLHSKTKNMQNSNIYIIQTHQPASGIVIIIIKYVLIFNNLETLNNLKTLSKSIFILIIL